MSPQEVMLQYGAIGAILLLALFAINRLFQRQIQMHEREIARADKAEAQLHELNVLIRDRLVESMTRAADAVVRATEIMADQRRGSDR